MTSILICLTKINRFKKITLYKKRGKKMNSRKCDVCNIDVHSASFAKHLRSKQHIDNE